MKTKKKDESAYYVKNVDLLREIKNYKETGKMSEELGGMILKIASGYANKGSFGGYTWKADMISEAVLTTCKYLHNFDLERANGFAYITTITHRAFLNYIKKQKRHSYIKDSCLKNADLFLQLEEMQFGSKAINYSLMVNCEEEEPKESNT